MAVEDDAQVAAGAVGDSNGGIEEELAVVRRLCYAAESPRELRRAVQVRLGFYVLCSDFRAAGRWEGATHDGMGMHATGGPNRIDVPSPASHTPHPFPNTHAHTQKFLGPLVAGTGGTEGPPQGGYPRPVTRALALLAVELALSTTANDYKGVGRAVREALGVGLAAAGRWPLLPEVLATVLTGACATSYYKIRFIWGRHYHN